MSIVAGIETNSCLSMDAAVLSFIKLKYILKNKFNNFIKPAIFDLLFKYVPIVSCNVHSELCHFSENLLVKAFLM
jgi:hypothetical protein